jgi:hypothetical protein
MAWASVPADPAVLQIQAWHTGYKVLSTIFLAPPDDDPIRFAGMKLGA